MTSAPCRGQGTPERRTSPRCYAHQPVRTWRVHRSTGDLAAQPGRIQCKGLAPGASRARVFAAWCGRPCVCLSGRAAAMRAQMARRARAGQPVLPLRMVEATRRPGDDAPLLGAASLRRCSLHLGELSWPGQRAPTLIPRLRALLPRGAGQACFDRRVSASVLIGCRTLGRMGVR